MSTRSDVIILTLASRSAGVVSRAELLEHGVSSSTIIQRADRGFLMRVWRGLYEVPEMTGPTTPLFRALKAVTCSALSALSAGRIHEAALPPSEADEPIHVLTTHGGARTEMPGVVVHRTRRPFTDDIVYPVPGLATLSPARTVLDLAGLSTISDRRLVHIIESLLTADRLEHGELIALLERPGFRGVAGAARLRTVVDSMSGGEQPAASALERRFAGFLLDHGITGFRCQVRPPWYDGRRGTVDFADEALRLIVEVDGRRWHSTTQAMTTDRRRDRLAAAHGWQVLRVSWGDLVDEPTRTAEHLIAAIAARRTHFVPRRAV